MRLWINTKKTNFRRVFSEIGNNLVPFQIGHIFEIDPSLVAGLVVCARRLVNASNAIARRTERSNLVFMIGSIGPTSQFHNKSYAAVALVRVRGPGIIDPGYSESMNQIDESVRETE